MTPIAFISKEMFLSHDLQILSANSIDWLLVTKIETQRMERPGLGLLHRAVLFLSRRCDLL